MWEPASTREGNREAKCAHTERGSVHQVLVYDDSACLGWCQYGSPAELPNIKNPASYQRGAIALPDSAHRVHLHWEQTPWRGRSPAPPWPVRWRRSALLGGGVVEAYPEQTVDRPPQRRWSYLHTGPEELFAELGFVRDRRIAKWRWVMRTTV